MNTVADLVIKFVKLFLKIAAHCGIVDSNRGILQPYSASMGGGGTIVLKLL